MKDTFTDLLTKTTAWIVVFFTPIVELFLFIGFLVFVDHILYRYKKKKDKLTLSDDQVDSLIKTFIYFSILIVARFVEVIYKVDYIIMGVAAYLIYLEAETIDKHIYDITGRRLLSLIKSKLKKNVLNEPSNKPKDKGLGEDNSAQG